MIKITFQLNKKMIVYVKMVQTNWYISENIEHNHKSTNIHLKMIYNFSVNRQAIYKYRNYVK